MELSTLLGLVFDVLCVFFFRLPSFFKLFLRFRRLSNCPGVRLKSKGLRQLLDDGHLFFENLDLAQSYDVITAHEVIWYRGPRFWIK